MIQTNVERTTHKNLRVMPEDVIGLKTDNPQMTLQEIGDRVGCTKERVKQILKKNGIGTSWAIKRGFDRADNCSQCNNEFDTIHYKLKGICRDCSNIEKSKDYDAIRKLVTCPNCKTTFQIRKKDPRVIYAAPNDPFCSYRCSALYNKVGHKYGFGSAIR